MRNRKGLIGAWMILLLATVANAADVAPTLTGSWKLEIVSPQGTRTPTMLLTQTGTQVTGTYRSMRGDVPIGGTIQGNEFALTVKISGQAGDSLTVEYKGRVTGDAVAGRVMMGPRGEANFTGKRVPST